MSAHSSFVDMIRFVKGPDPDMPGFYIREGLFRVMAAVGLALHVLAFASGEPWQSAVPPTTKALDVFSLTLDEG
jgi:hypothetical protein